MTRIALCCLTALTLGACANRPYGAYAPDAQFAESAPLAAGAYADMRHAAPSVVIDPLPLPLDPAPLPPNTAPGDCVVRIAAGPSYRWERAACPPASMTTLSSVESYQQSYAYSVYPGPPPQGYVFGYPTAGRDAQGYLTWPGKVPAR